MLVDSHCHLNLGDLKGNEDAVIERALAAQVKYLQTICTKLEDLPALLEITAKHANVYCSVGIHPHEVETSPDITYETLLRLANSDKKIIGIGETGLDYFYEHSLRDIQKASFANHIHVAAQTQKPLIVHSREADSDTIDILSSEMKNSSYKGLIHCFSSTKELAQSSLDIGLYISIAGIVTFKTAETLREIVSYLPLDRMLIETDSPYLAPIPMRGRTNEPAFVEFVARKIAEIKNISFEEVACVTTKNFCELFLEKAI